MTENKEEPTFLMEIAWEVCNQVGGIYTVLLSKAQSVIQKWDENYCLIGPYFPEQAETEFEESENEEGIIPELVKSMKEEGYDIHFGRWLVYGRPKVVLINPFSVYEQLSEIKHYLWDKHSIPTHGDVHLLDQVAAFSHLVNIFLKKFTHPKIYKGKLLAHFHEWMTGPAIPMIRREGLPIGVIFTSHATLLGRYLAMNDPNFYAHLPFVNWETEAQRFNIESEVKIERAAAHGCHIFTTVSEVTARECIKILGRKPDQILPNGLNIERFSAIHEVQNLHSSNKELIHEFTMGHFFQRYSFNLDNVLYFFTSGRYEYKNKGYDLTIEALARLNYKMKQAGMDTIVVMFFITRRPFYSINPAVLQSRAVMEELRETCEAIQKQVGDRLFYAAASGTDHRLPSLNHFVDDYWRLRYRRTLQSWKSTQNLPAIVTHNLINDQTDELLNFLRSTNMINKEEDNVKVVYHPDFISPTNPLFGMEYGQFVRGCHLGIFPSYYEPWGYTPLESLARGVPAVTSDLSGFGDYVMHNIPNYEDLGIYVTKRLNKSFEEAASQLADQLFDFVHMARKDRISLRYKVEDASENFDWLKLTEFYDKAYQMAAERAY